MAGLPMRKILGDRACNRHPDCPTPCVQCAGVSLSQVDQSRGGYRGIQRRFKAEPDHDEDDDSEEVGTRQPPSAVNEALRAWGIKPGALA
jgi:hypothetical protein